MAIVRFVTSSSRGMSSRTLIEDPPATLHTVPAGTSTVPAAIVASTTSPTKVKSRIWRPVP